MNYQQFSQQVIEILCSNNKDEWWMESQKEKLNEQQKISIEWTTGGITGGSCWDNGDSAHYAVEPEPEPEFEQLDQLLEKLIPTMTLWQYKKLIKNVVEFNSSSKREYYGNERTTTTKSVEFGRLFDYLTDEKLI